MIDLPGFNRLSKEAVEDCFNIRLDSIMLVHNLPEIFEGAGEQFYSMTLTNGSGKSINLNELLYLIKRYCFALGYSIICYRTNKGYVSDVISEHFKGKVTPNGRDIHDVRYNSEAECILMAYSWIKEQETKVS